MGVRVVFPDMGKDPSVQLIEKTITENGTYDAITDGANGYSKVNVNVEGGGGGSDFSTAELTFINGDSDVISIDFSVPCFDTNLTLYKEGVDTFIPMTFSEILQTKKGKQTEGIEVGGSETFNVLTYKNKIVLEGLANLYAILETDGCTVTRLLTEPNRDAVVVALVEFTSNTASIKVKYTQ